RTLAASPAVLAQALLRVDPSVPGTELPSTSALAGGGACSPLLGSDADRDAGASVLAVQPSGLVPHLARSEGAGRWRADRFFAATVSGWPGDLSTDESWLSGP